MINWAYIAGFFDGEGSLNPRQGTVSLAQKDREVLDVIKQFLESQGIPASIYEHHGSKNHDLQHRLSVLTVAGKLRAMRELLPFLIVKKQLVEDYLRFRKWCPSMNARHRGFSHHPVRKQRC